MNLLLIIVVLLLLFGGGGFYFGGPAIGGGGLGLILLICLCLLYTSTPLHGCHGVFTPWAEVEIIQPPFAAVGQRRRRGIFVEKYSQKLIWLRQERHGGRPQGLCRPDGAWDYFNGIVSTKIPLRRSYG